MWENCILLPILLIFSPFLIHNEFPHLDFPITKTQLHILKTEWPKSKVESWFEPARKVFVKRLFWFLGNTWRDSALCVPETPRGEHFIFKSRLHYSAYLSSLPAFKRMNSLCRYCTQTFFEKVIYSGFFFFFQARVRRCYTSAKPHVLQHILTLWFHFCGNDFKGTTLGRWDVKLLWNSTHVCSMSAPLCSVVYLFFFSPIYSTLRSPFTALKNKKWSSVGMQEDCFHSAAIRPLQMEREWKAFCFVLFFSVRYRILGIRLHIRPDHNCLLLTGELLVFHLKPASVRFHH